MFILRHLLLLSLLSSCWSSPQTERIPVAFVFWYTPDHAGAKPYWHDPGFRGAMDSLVSTHQMDTVWFNVAEEGAEGRLREGVANGRFSFVFAKGCWHTPADKTMRGLIIPALPPGVRTGLFPACSSPPPPDVVTGIPIDRAYDVIFYDKHWLRPQFQGHPRAVHAFGVDSPATFNASGPIAWVDHPKLFDYVSVGMFAPWKRHEAILEKKGDRLVVGYGWRSDESSAVVSALFTGGVAVWQQVRPESMCGVYRASRRVLMAANEVGGGERVILEARACGVPVEAIEVAADNRRVREFLEGVLPDTEYYAAQIASGIRGALGDAPGGEGGFRISVKT